MKHFLASLGVAACLCAELAFAADPLVIIDTHFALKTAEGGIQTIPAADVVTALPLTAPTSVTIPPGEASATIAADPMGSLQAPYLLLTSGVTEDDAKRAAVPSLSWDLLPLKLTGGKYTLTYRVVPMGKPFSGGAMVVNVARANGVPIALQPEQSPLRVKFSDRKRIFTNLVEKQLEQLDYQLDEIYEVRVTFDLDAKTWTAQVNGVTLVQDEPLTKVFGAAPVMLSELNFTGTNLTDTSVALGDVKLVREPDAPPTP